MIWLVGKFEFEMVSRVYLLSTDTSAQQSSIR